MNVVIVCAFFESAMQSFRENQFAERLSRRGHNVTVITSDQSYIWKRNRAKVAPTSPTKNDEFYLGLPNLRLVRRKPLVRLGDFVLFPLSKADFATADVVHVLDFRQGVTAVAARIASSLSKPVIYDHEQRGDRVGSRLHFFDNRLRKAFIRYGARAPSLIRHTVIANRQFFERVAPQYRGEFALTPLGVNEKVFYRDANLRAQVRGNLGLDDTEKMFLFTGKIDVDKRPVDVMRAMAKSGKRLFIAGKVSDTVKKDAGEFEHVVLLGEKTQAELNALYNAADCAMFTTFSLSYWEALAAGTNIIVPSTEFSKQALSRFPGVILFGEPEMFAVEEERYREDVALDEKLLPAILAGALAPKVEDDRNWLNWDEKIRVLEEQYSKVTGVSLAL